MATPAASRLALAPVLAAPATRAIAALPSSVFSAPPPRASPVRGHREQRPRRDRRDDRLPPPSVAHATPNAAAAIAEISAMFACVLSSPSAAAAAAAEGAALSALLGDPSRPRVAGDPRERVGVDEGGGGDPPEVHREREVAPPVRAEGHRVFGGERAARDVRARPARRLRRRATPRRSRIASGRGTPGGRRRTTATGGRTRAPTTGRRRRRRRRRRRPGEVVRGGAPRTSPRRRLRRGRWRPRWRTPTRRGRSGRGSSGRAGSPSPRRGRRRGRGGVPARPSRRRRGRARRRSRRSARTRRR